MEENCTFREWITDWRYTLPGLMILGGLILTIISFYGLCTAECAEGHKYRIFGLHFETIGLLFFITLTTIHLLIPKYSALIGYEGLLLANAAGAEIIFILVQKYVIGGWCPVCLGIATCVFIAFGVHILRLNETNKGKIMKKTIGFFKSSIALVLGVLIAFFGITKFDALEAAQTSVKESLSFGKKDSPIEVYLFTDWACPACRKLEPQIKEISNQVMKEGKLIFVDHAIHPETLNFAPYHLSFLIKNKPQYFKLRDMLTELSKETGSPNDEQIATLAAKAGVRYQELNYSDISLGLKYFKTLGDKFDIKGTPTMIIINTETKKGKKLTGTKEITEKNVIEAIRELKQ